MIDEYVIKLIDNLPENIRAVKTPQKIDLVLDGGAFNGSYLIGALYFLKEMEKRNYVVIERISGCSIGSLVGFLYYIDSLDLMAKLYDIISIDFRKTYQLNVIKQLKKYLIKKIPDNICEKIKNKLFITYNNIEKGEKCIKSSYKNIDDIIHTIIRSCYLPFIIDGNIVYKNKYIDGFNPYIFNKEPNKKILYLDLFGFDKIVYMINVKNEKSNFHRILSGLLDIHSFYIKQSNTAMCSYVNDWNMIHLSLNGLKWSLEKIVIYLVYLTIYFKKHMPDYVKDSVLYKIMTKITQDIFIIMLENYCL